MKYQVKNTTGGYSEFSSLKAASKEAEGPFSEGYIRSAKTGKVLYSITGRMDDMGLVYFLREKDQTEVVLNFPD